MEVLEKVCETFDDYGLTQTSVGGKRKLGVLRTKNRKTGEDLNLANVGANENLKNTFKGYVSLLLLLLLVVVVF